ncbi:MAG: MBL fold metallo-hydrolase [Acutalibacteraceae bacterium]|jgi:phosphoribosyl 1,2-cyclic phosphodiesterase
MAKICPLFSGSTGNSTYIGTENGGILIDAGASAKGIEKALERAGASFEEVKAVAITHTHSDHICGLKTVLKKTGAVLVARQETVETLTELEYIPAGTKIEVIDRQGIDINGICINNFITSHDCEGSCGYTFILPDGKKVAICTDLGIVTDEVRSALHKSYAVLIESNHDIEMLKKGPYPPFLKVRIMSDNGHISNSVCAGEVLRLFKNGTTRFILGHLSLKNNTPLLARSVSEAVLADIGAKNGRDYILCVAEPKENGVTVI